MSAGEFYDPASPSLVAARRATAGWLLRLAAAAADAPEPRRALLAERLADIGEGAEIRAPFHCDYGFNIRLGARVFLNFGCVILDVAPVTIGEGAQLGPGAKLIAADHPRDPERRRAGLEFGRPVTIGANAWIGAGAIILPGVTVGEDAIVAAGAVVTRDVAPGATVLGVPARPG
ncbi:MAG: sugar O-acetyltransferase [Methylobacteriaceae bacterium]|nr:sugar O-acetyltransferase [Methylobacteriaceae bacterium]